LSAKALNKEIEIVMKTIDSMQAPVTRSAPAQSTPQSVPNATGARFTKLRGTRPKRRIPWSLVATVGASPVLFGLAMLGNVGLVAVAVYGVGVLATHQPSRNVFALALAALLYMVGLQMAANSDLAQSMATQVYALLAIGVISLALEVKSASRMWFKKH
jgi:hypothetical protein